MEVHYGQQAPIIIPVSSLLAGETTIIGLPFPSGCFNPDCDFEIIVDSTDAIDESNELNNSQTGSCLG